MEKQNIVLEKGKEYMVYIATCFASSYPIVQLCEKYNPIFICAENAVDAPKNNFISFEDEFKSNNLEVNWKNFADILLNSGVISELFDSLKEHQRHVWVKLFKNNLAFKPLFNDHNIKCLGLTPEQSHTWNDKIYQYEQLSPLVPIAKFIVTSKEQAVGNFDKLRTANGVFTHLPRSGQGEGVRIHHDKESLRKYLNQIVDDQFLMIKTLSVKSSPSIDILIADDDEIFVYGLADQLLDNLVCLGAIYPSSLSKEIKRKCYEIAYTVGKKLATDGIRGIVGIDLIVDKTNNVYFCEVNARYAGTTHNRMLAMEQVRPSDTPSIMDLEVMAIKEGTFNGYKLWDEPKEIYWYKKEIFSEYDGTIMPLSIPNDALELYKKREGIVIVGQRAPGSTVIKKKTSLGNVIAVQRTRQDLEESISLIDTIISEYVKK